MAALVPVLLASYPVLALAAANAGETAPSAGLRALLVSAAAASLLWLLLRVVLRDAGRAAVLASALVLLFFSYGHVYQLLRSVELGGWVVGRHRFLVPIWATLALAAIGISSVHRLPAASLVRFGLGMALIAVLLPAGRLGLQVIRESRAISLDFGAQAESGGRLPSLSEEQLPDIYYIILDGYARSDVYRDRFGYDNTDFIQWLEARGFYVASESYANYMFTYLSLASSLNLDHLQNLYPGVETAAVRFDRDAAIKHSRVRATLEALGYQTVAFVTGWEDTELFDADIVFTPDITGLQRLHVQGMINPLEAMLLSSSAARLLLDLDSLRSTPLSAFVAERHRSKFDVQRETVLGIFENLEGVPRTPGPKFVFAHVVSPHEPYLFAADGSSLWPEGPFTLADNDDIPEDEQVALYVGQSKFIDSRVSQAIDVILDRSSRPVVIILQSDHGPGFGLDWEAPDPQAAEARAAILNAYYLPESCQNVLYPSITPVNTFRLIFRCVLGEEIDLLEDRSFAGHEDTMVPLESVIP